MAMYRKEVSCNKAKKAIVSGGLVSHLMFFIWIWRVTRRFQTRDMLKSKDKENDTIAARAEIAVNPGLWRNSSILFNPGLCRNSTPANNWIDHSGLPLLFDAFWPLTVSDIRIGKLWVYLALVDSVKTGVLIVCQHIGPKQFFLRLRSSVILRNGFDLCSFTNRWKVKWSAFW